jgi:hypothetical protein
MSTHNIFITCRMCGMTEQLYTGSADVENFQNNSYEGECLKATCDECDTMGENNVE